MAVGSCDVQIFIFIPQYSYLASLFIVMLMSLQLLAQGH